MKNRIKPKITLSEGIYAPLFLLLQGAILLPPDNFWFGILQSYAVQILLLDIGLLVVWILRKKILAAAITILGIVMLLAFLWPYFHKTAPLPNTQPDLTVAHFNVLATNTDYEKTLRAAWASGADILSFQEVTTEWIDILSEVMGKEYPYIVYQEDTDYRGFYGVILLSKFPIKQSKIEYWQDLPNITATLATPKADILVVTSHTFSPVSEKRYEGRNRHLENIADFVKGQNATTLVIGDFNIVPWAAQVTAFKEHTGLLDSRHNLSPTFPAWNTLMMVPIDYIFHSPDIESLDFNIIAQTASDHYGVVGKYRIPPATR